MLPFSKRPPPPEEYFLRSGDFEAVQAPPSHRSQAQQAAMPVVPPAPRAPVFARHAAPTPYGFSQNQPQPYGYANLAAPPAPHSLAPVAMGSGSHTGPSTVRRAQTVVLREKPSLKWGVMIALTGALLGGVLGLGMDAKRQHERAAASEARDEAPATPAALPTQAAVNPLPAPAVLPVGTTLAGNGALAAPIAVAAPAPVALAAPTPVVLASPAPVIVTPAPKHEPPARHARAAPPAKHPSFVAAKVSAPKPPPAEKAEKPEPAKADKPAKAGSSDARKVLEDAIKDTTNTL